jgi:hypothetical protein
MRCALLKAGEIAAFLLGRPLTPTLSPQGEGASSPNMIGYAKNISRGIPSPLRGEG